MVIDDKKLLSLLNLSEEDVTPALVMQVLSLLSIVERNQILRDCIIMEDLVKKYDMTYVDIHDMFLANDNYLPKKLEIHPTTLGYKAMAKSVISLIDKKTLAK